MNAASSLILFSEYERSFILLEKDAAVSRNLKCERVSANYPSQEKTTSNKYWSALKSLVLLTFMEFFLMSLWNFLIFLYVLQFDQE